MMRICLVFFSMIVLVSCREKKTIPDNSILKPDKMQAVLWDVIKAEAFTAQILNNNPGKKGVDENLKLQQQVFAIHHVSKEDFYKSYDYYKAHPGLLKIIMDSMIIQEQRNKVLQ